MSKNWAKISWFWVKLLGGSYLGYYTSDFWSDFASCLSVYVLSVMCQQIFSISNSFLVMSYSITKKRENWSKSILEVVGNWKDLFFRYGFKKDLWIHCQLFKKHWVCFSQFVTQWAAHFSELSKIWGKLPAKRPFTVLKIPFMLYIIL